MKMKKAGKRFISMVITVTMVMGIVAVGGGNIKANAAGYNSDAAISYTKSHWNDGVGVCDQFVKACLSAGGVTITAGGVANVKNALLNGGYGTLYKLSSSASGKYQVVKASNNSGKVKVGDPLFTVCSKCGWLHTVIMGGTNSSGYITVYAHNSAKNNEQYYAECYNGCGASNVSIYSVSMNVSTTPPDTTPPTISSCYATQQDSSGYTAVVIFDDNVGVTSVRFATWTEENGQDDLVWANGYIEAGGKSSYTRVPYSEHNGLSYITDVYVYDAAGNGACDTIRVYLDTEAPKITAYGINQTNQDSFVVYC